MADGSEFFPSLIDLAGSAVQTIQSGHSNPRVVYDDTGITAYDINGNVILKIDALGGSATLAGAVSAHGFDFYDDQFGFHYRLTSARPAGNSPVWSFVSPTWAQVKAPGLTWAQAKARCSNGNWGPFRKAFWT